MSKYKKYEELKKELGDDYDMFMYEMNLELVKQKEKAIEYINYKKQDLEQFNGCDLLANEYLQFTINLLNILQGDDKE